MLPDLPQAQPLVGLPASPKRIRPRDTNDGTMPASISSGILERIKNDDPAGAKLLLDGIDANLSPEARAEWRQKVAWSFYIENDDASAYAVAQTAALGSGPWVAEGWWTAGLAAWRLGDYAAGTYVVRTRVPPALPRPPMVPHHLAQSAAVGSP